MQGTEKVWGMEGGKTLKRQAPAIGAGVAVVGSDPLDVVGFWIVLLVCILNTHPVRYSCILSWPPINPASQSTWLC